MNYERVERSLAIERTRRISRTFFQKQHIFKFDRVNSFGKLNNKLFHNLTSKLFPFTSTIVHRFYLFKHKTVEITPWKILTAQKSIWKCVANILATRCRAVGEEGHVTCPSCASPWYRLFRSKFPPWIKPRLHLAF